MKPRLGVNIDHVATLRQARGGSSPDPVRAAVIAEGAGADGITLHLREDRRHVQESDLRAIVDAASVPVNLELAVDPEVVAIAVDVGPANCCLVPERRKELTTEGGLDVAGSPERIGEVVAELQAAGIKVQLFLDPDEEQLEAGARAGADGVEIHTGAYANASTAADARAEMERIGSAAFRVRGLRLRLHAGHGLDYRNVVPVAQIEGMEELNIGHAIIARALFDGLGGAVRHMKRLITGDMVGSATD
ncbi:MAG: pyridoxine 5'-phosphate synthase [Gemmatimonadetes bacterium]|nr:pyridoxine 5'-phosphate synthase [Gemmatimonadota bacterium]